MGDASKPERERSALRQFYVAVGTLDAKLATLLDLMRAFESVAAPLGLVVCCGARDSLDAVCSAALGLENTRVWCLHADMSEREVDSTVQRFKSACTDPSSIRADGSLKGVDSDTRQPTPEQIGSGNGAEQQRRQQRGSGDGSAESKEAGKPRALIEVLATTDVCLRVISKDLVPLNPTLLVSYDPPTRKDVYLRRVTAVLGSRAAAGGRPRIAVYFAAAGQLEELRAVEGFAERPLQEMPVHVTDILAGAPAPGAPLAAAASSGNVGVGGAQQ